MKTVTIDIHDPVYGDDARLRVSDENLSIVLDALIERGRGGSVITPSQ